LSRAPDLWAWRGGVYAFLPPAASAPAIGFDSVVIPTGGHVAPNRPRPDGADNRSMAERSRRVAEIRAWLARKPAPPDELLAAPLDELGRLLHDLGDYDAALQHWRDVELPLHRRLGDERAGAVTMGQIADILQARGQLDEALRIRQEEQLPVFERLGDVR
jgi:tetratricopeptide (TPR) repeat protein